MEWRDCEGLLAVVVFVFDLFDAWVDDGLSGKDCGDCDFEDGVWAEGV